MKVRILHNPRCSKSRATLALLQEREVDAEVVLYLESPPSVSELESILSMLGLEPRELMRKGEDEYKELGLDDQSLSRDQLINAMVSHPRLIERPIVIAGHQAAIGRPPENVLNILWTE
jgi:arsenate reductase